jgi:acetoin utilization deacetylase AcuC-like enzyme
MDQPVPVVWSPRTREHDPLHEVWVGVATSAVETSARVDAILAALATGEYAAIEAEADPGDLLGVVHSAELLGFLRSCHDRWLEGGYADLVGQHRVIPYLFPTPAMGAGLPLRRPAAVHAEAGTFAYDTMTAVGPGTWVAASAAAACAAHAAGLVAGGEPLAYALCRPPGHHATPVGFGGSCYLNNSAVAAEGLRRRAFSRVAVLDLDAHHGNGTAAVFYERADVLYGSVHVDPGAGWFPHYVGFPDETGAGDGAGATRNLPLPPGTGDDDWLAGVADLAAWAARDCAALVVSLGVDAAATDPESPLEVTDAGFRAAGRLLGATGLPAVVVQEGGYDLASLGRLVRAYLDGHRASLADS